ncbi:MAG: hypothetical protein Athens101428_268, partial [Candidatus Berkelbacteria bacterium Athens1014_28]
EDQILQELPEEMKEEIKEANEKIEQLPKLDFESKKRILDELDADALLMRQILESRKGWQGKLNRLKSSKAVKFLGTATAATILSKSISALGAGAPLTGGIVGGAMGGLVNYCRSRGIVEGASNWQTGLGIFNKGRAELEEMTTGQLEASLGVLNSAIREGRVRGNATELAQLVGKYREIRDILTKSKIGADALNEAVETESQIGRAIADGAKEQYKDLYKEIMQGKRKQILASAVKGIALGAITGASIGWLVQHFFGATSVGNQELQDKMEGIREVNQQNAGVASGIEQLGAHSDQEKMILNHILNIRAEGGSPSGFSDEGLKSFVQMVGSHMSGKELIHNAAINNIDLASSVEGSRPLIDFITANRDAFLQATPEVQRGILSFPQLAGEILSAGTNETAAAAAAKITGAIGLAAIGLGIGGLVAGRQGSTKTEKGFTGVATEAAKKSNKPVVPAEPTSPTPEETPPAPPKPPTETPPPSVEPPIVPEVSPGVSALSSAGEDDKKPKPAPPTPEPKKEITETEAKRIANEALTEGASGWQVMAKRSEPSKSRDEKFILNINYLIDEYMLGSEKGNLVVRLKHPETKKTEVIPAEKLLNLFRYKQIENKLVRDAMKNWLSTKLTALNEAKEKIDHGAKKSGLIAEMDEVDNVAEATEKEKVKKGTSDLLTENGSN